MQTSRSNAARTSESSFVGGPVAPDRSLNTSTGLGRSQATGIQAAVEPGGESEFSTGINATSRLSAYTAPALLLGISAASFLGASAGNFYHKHIFAGLVEAGLGIAMALYSYLGWNAPTKN